MSWKANVKCDKCHKNIEWEVYEKWRDWEFREYRFLCSECFEKVQKTIEEYKKKLNFIYD